MDKKKFLFLVMALLFGLQLTGCVWYDRDYYRDHGYYEQERGHGRDQYGRDKYGFPRGHQHD